MSADRDNKRLVRQLVVNCPLTLKNFQAEAEFPDMLDFEELMELWMEARIAWAKRMFLMMTEEAHL
jgi:hypothetical protein